MRQVMVMIEDLLIEFDEYGFAPRITMPNAEEYARQWREKLVFVIQKLQDRINELSGDFVKGYEACLDEGWDDAVKDTAKEILQMLHDLGGCDATDEWCKGWDKAIDTAYEAIQTRYGVEVG